MKKHVLLAALVIGAAACTLKVSDNNPLNAEIRGAGAFAPSIANGELTLNGSSLQNVLGLKIGPAKDNLPIIRKEPQILVATLPSVLALPAMLFVETANAETPVALDALDTLNVNGDMIVSGKVTMGYQKVSNLCAGGAGLCLANCPNGKVAVAGGCKITPSTIGTSSNYPSDAGQWACQPSAAATSTEAWVICANTGY